VSDANGQASLYRKLAEVTAEVGHVPKRGRNDFHKYDYVTEADLLDAVRAKLADRHVAVIPSLHEIRERETDRSIVTTATVTFTFVDGDTGAMHAAQWAGQGDDPADKGLYKAYTGAMKYFVMKAFLIPTGDDPEADAATDQRVNSPDSARQPAKPQVRDPHAPASGPQKGAIKRKLADARAWAGSIGIEWDGNPETLRKGDASALLDALHSGKPIPTGQSDVSSDPSGFEVREPTAEEIAGALPIDGEQAA
jgi:hypothetical protein